MTSHKQKFEWPNNCVLVSWRTLRSYATWLFPQLGLRWQAEGVTDPERSGTKDRVEPYQFPKASGLVSLRQFPGFVDYVRAPLAAHTAKDPYTPPKGQRPLSIEELRSFDAWVQAALERRRRADDNLPS